MRSRVTREPPLFVITYVPFLYTNLSFSSLLIPYPRVRHIPKIDIIITYLATVTRSHKLNDRDHPAEDMMGSRDHIPRYFAKSGPTDADPRKTKKDGGGKGNW